VDAALEFTIAREEKRYKVTVRTDGGRREGFFEVDQSVESEMRKIRKAIEELRPLDRESVEKFGSKLFEMLFSASKDLVHDSMDQSDYLTIILNMKDSSLHEIPWELCYDPEREMYLAADSQCSLVRRDQKSTRHFGKIDYPLKILVIISSPFDLDEKEFQPDPDEVVALMSSVQELEDKGKVTVDFLERASVKHIQDKLKEGYHIVHFVGHGVYDSENGYLVIEDKARNAKNLEARGVALLFGVNPPQLVILTACESSPVIPFLLSRKVPAVLAMQYTVLKEMAYQFMERFYSFLVKGETVVQAVSNARSAVQLDEEVGCTGWFTPVLYVRADDILQVNSDSSPVLPEKGDQRHDMIIDLLGVENFVGRRKDLWLIEKALLEDDLKVTVVIGIGGIGKTALASKFVEKHKYRFRGVFAKNMADIEMGVEGILGLLDQFLMEYGDRRLHEVIGEVDLNVKLGRLNECLKDTYLIILDNFEPLLKDKRIADGSMEMFLRTFLSGDHSSKIIITSQYGFTFADERAGGLIRYVDLKELNLQDTMKLLERLGVKDLKTRTIVHEEIGGNPLILELFVKLAETRSVEGLLKDLTPMREKIGELLLHGLIEPLTEKEQEVLKKLSVFRLKVDRSIFDVLGVSVGVMDRLVYYSLVKAEHGHYFMHQGVKQYVLGLLSDDEKVEAHNEAVNYYRELSSRQRRNLSAIVELHHHLIESGQHKEARKMAIGLVEPFSKGGYWEPLVKLLEKTMEITEDKTNAAELHSLGIVFQSLGEYKKAEELYKRSLDISKKLGDKKGIARSLYHQGMIHQLRGEYEKAEELYEKSLDISEKLGDKKGIARSLYHQGMIHQLRGEYEKAEELYEESLAISEELGDNQGIAASFHQLGIIYQLRGEYEKAEELYKRSLDISRKLGDKRGIAASFHQLGMIHQLRREYEKAEKMYKKSLDISEDLGDKKGIAESYHQLGTIYEEKGEYKEAEKWYRKSLDIKRSLGDNHGIAQSLHHLGIIHEVQGEYKEAIQNYYNSIAIFLQLGSPDVENVIRDLKRMRKIIGEERFAEYWKTIPHKKFQDIP
jgi:tetratricopeptide (TPR) repeat protein